MLPCMFLLADLFQSINIHTLNSVTGAHPVPQQQPGLEREPADSSVQRPNHLSPRVPLFPHCPDSPSFLVLSAESDPSLPPPSQSWLVQPQLSQTDGRPPPTPAASWPPGPHFLGSQLSCASSLASVAEGTGRTPLPLHPSLGTLSPFVYEGLCSKWSLPTRKGLNGLGGSESEFPPGTPPPHTKDSSSIASNAVAALGTLSIGGSPKPQVGNPPPPLLFTQFLLSFFFLTRTPMYKRPPDSFVNHPQDHTSINRHECGTY